MKYGTLLLFALALSCSPKDPVPEPSVSDYLPLKKGGYQVYTVDSTVVDQNTETAYLYELKTFIADSFPNSEGGYTYVIQRSKRQTPPSPWTALETWSARATKFEGVISEGNLSYVKLLSPMENGKVWDGNALNTMGGTEKCLGGDFYKCDLYTIGEFRTSYEVAGGEKFENTVLVVQNDNKDLIVALDKRTERYARNVGLIERSITQLTYCTDPSCVGTQFIVHGLKYKQSISEHGGW